MIDTVVVGAGLSGLTRADALARSGQDVLLLEESSRAGGVVSSEMRDGFLLEKGPNTVRPTAPLWQLVVGLDLEGEALLADPREPRFIDFQGSLQPVPMSLKSFFSTPLLSWRGKLRLLAEFSVMPSRERVESVASFFQRRLGQEVAERFVEPFISGVFAGDAWQLDVAECFPKLARWERDFSSLTFGALVERWRASGPPPVRGLLTRAPRCGFRARDRCGSAGDSASSPGGSPPGLADRRLFLSAPRVRASGGPPAGTPNPGSHLQLEPFSGSRPGGPVSGDRLRRGYPRSRGGRSSRPGARGDRRTGSRGASPLFFFRDRADHPLRAGTPPVRPGPRVPDPGTRAHRKRLARPDFSRQLPGWSFGRRRRGQRDEALVF